MEKFEYFYNYNIAMEKTTVVMDKQGRIYLPRQIKKDLGRKFFVVKINKDIILVPVPSDPVKELERIGKGLPKKSIKRFRKEILEETSKVI
jgi:bifunctional DNA-binding transcriptional regulator/antitoxin component of YhaV-PrlF toxin-antitoxin module